MKGNKKAKWQTQKSTYGVSSVVGVSLMLAIVVPIAGVVAMQFVNLMDSQRRMMGEQIEAMQRFSDYLSGLQFGGQGGPGCGNCSNQTTPPFVEYEWNCSTLQWVLYISQGHGYEWVVLYPPYVQGNATQGTPFEP